MEPKYVVSDCSTTSCVFDFRLLYRLSEYHKVDG